MFGIVVNGHQSMKKCRCAWFTLNIFAFLRKIVYLARKRNPASDSVDISEEGTMQESCRNGF